MARLLHFADVHLDAPFAWAEPGHARRRRRALREALSHICQLAQELGVDALCCAGDLYEHERVTPDTAAFLRDCFARVHPLPVLLAPGNHDWLGPASLYRTVSWSDNVHVFAEPNLRPVSLDDGLTVWGAAHCAPANTGGFLDDFVVDRGGVHLALFHGSERGDFDRQESGKQPHAPFSATSIEPAGLHHAMVGHFHTPREGRWFTYPGNPEPLSFGETGSRGAVLVTVADDGSVTRQRYGVAATEVSDLEVAVDGVAHVDEVRERIEHTLRRARGTVRLTVSGTLDPDVELSLDDLRQLTRPAALGLDNSALDVVVLRIGRVEVGYDYDRLAGEPTVRGQFVRDVRAATDLTDEQRQRVLVTGLRALDGRSLDVAAVTGER